MKRSKAGTLLFVALVSITLAGCSAWTYTQSLFVAAISLETVGQQFAAISEQVTLGCESKAIPVQTCQRYRVFGDHFKRSYPIAVGMWRAADKAGDTMVKRKAEDVVRSLSEDLGTFTTEALGAFTTETK